MKLLGSLLRLTYFLTIVACLFVFKWARHRLSEIRYSANENVKRAAYALYASSVMMTDNPSASRDDYEAFLAMKGKLNDALFERERAYSITLFDIIKGGKDGQNGSD